jgi:hypothetical protein
MNKGVATGFSNDETRAPPPPPPPSPPLSLSPPRPRKTTCALFFVLHSTKLSQLQRCIKLHVKNARSKRWLVPRILNGLS